MISRSRVLRRRESRGVLDGRALSRCAAAALPVLVLLPGCTVGPDYDPPALHVPDAWHQQLSDGLMEGETGVDTWWEVLNDPLLDSLIDRATAGNLDLREAFYRVKESRAFRGVATGERFPDLDGLGSVERDRQSEDLYQDFGPLRNQTDWIFGLGVDASWEIDLWGRITRSIESTDATLEASIEDYRDVMVVLLADVALNYVEARALQERIRYAEGNIQTQRGALKVTQDRLKAQISPELDVRQAELNLARTESVLPVLRTLLAAAIHRLGVLLGEEPGALWEELIADGSVPHPPGEIDLGIPANLLRQRPDLRQAERRLAAQTARIGVATADLYPRFSLSGSFAFMGTHDLFDARRNTWNFGPSFRWNLFDGGRVRNSILVEDARTEQALVRYEQTLLLAMEEVENAIVSYVQEIQRRHALARSVRAAEESVKLVETLYRTGLTDFQNVLDMQRSLFEEQDAFAESDGTVTQNLVRIYKALGGGWVPDTAVLAEEIQDEEEKGEPIF